MNAMELALWHLTGALRNAQLHRRAFCHAKRYPHRGVWVDGTKWPDLEGCAKCQRTLRRVSYAWTLAYVLYPRIWWDSAYGPRQRADQKTP